MQKFAKYAHGGITGLTNLGNTCYLNSCLQALSNTYELNEILDRLDEDLRVNDEKAESLLLVEWNSLRKLMWSKNCTIAPNRFIKAVQRVATFKEMLMFSGFAQNDLPEFLLFLIDCFHTSLSRKIKFKIVGKSENETDEIAIKCYEMIKETYSRDYSEIWKLFFAVHVSEIVSLDSSRQVLSTRPEPFFMLHLPIPSTFRSPHLLDCLEHYLSGEVLEGENAWYNEKTKTKEAVCKRTRFFSLPEILIIDFKRFNNSRMKNQILIEFPFENLDLSPYVIGYKKSSYVYDLYAVCNHSGNTMGGHYTVYVKNANGKWFLYNDTFVSEVPLLQSIVSPKAYCLFYRKKKDI
jgi:ubiquitin carboxyl-terminal hydrolase 8